MVLLCLITQSCPTLCNPVDWSPPGSSVRGDSPGKHTVVGGHALLQRIFPTQGSNPDLPHCRWILYHLSHQRSPYMYMYFQCVYNLYMCVYNYLYNEILLSHKKEWNFSFFQQCGWISQIKNDKWYHLYVEPKKCNELVNITKRTRLTDIGNKLMATTGERKVGRGNIGAGE